MRNKIVYVPCVTNPVKSSPGFEKKDLSMHKIDVMALCGYGCRYCSSNMGNYLRIHQDEFADLTEAALGVRLLPNDDPSLALLWPDVIERLERQLGGVPRPGGRVRRSSSRCSRTDSAPCWSRMGRRKRRSGCSSSGPASESGS